jgi:predicted patatin/cPLA2 family phospholipase
MGIASKLARAIAKKVTKKKPAKKVIKKKPKTKSVPMKPMKPMPIKEEMKMLRAIGLDIYDTGTKSGKYTDKELREVIRMMRADDKVVAKKKK